MWWNEQQCKSFPRSHLYQCIGRRSQTEWLHFRCVCQLCFSFLYNGWLWHETLQYSTFSKEFDDFFITCIAGNCQTSTEFWGIALNFNLIQVGGCQQQVKLADEILFAFNAFNAAHFLKLTGPKTALVGQPVLFTVTDGSTGSPVAGAVVATKTSDASGNVEVIFEEAGVTQLKATKSDSIRSNQVTTLVIPILVAQESIIY